MARKKRFLEPIKPRSSPFVWVAVGTLIMTVIMVGMIFWVETKEVEKTYSVTSEDMDSPYAIFDRTMLLNSGTKAIYLNMQERGRRNSDIFLQPEYYKELNQQLQEKYSTLAVVIDQRVVYEGDTVMCEDMLHPILSEPNSETEKDGKYIESNGHEYFLKKMGFMTKDGKEGSMCIITKLDVQLPHILAITWGMVIVMSLLLLFVVLFGIGFTYYNILLPIRELGQAAKDIGAGDMDTELKSRAGQFEELYREFNDMRRALRTSNKERDEMDALTKEVVGNISHDLKTPLTAIRGYAEGILDGVATTPERMRKYVDVIYTKAKDMSRLVEDLSYFTRMYQKKEIFNFDMVRVKEFVAECVPELSMDLETQGMSLVCVCDVSSRTEVYMDRDKIKRVIVNITSNAVKYMNREEGVVLFKITEDLEQVEFMIQDNGRGIPADELPMIFDRFYRTDSSRNSKTGGSGLGLAIVKKIIEEHMGVVGAGSKERVGTAIYFTLPKGKEIKNMLQSKQEESYEERGERRE